MAQPWEVTIGFDCDDEDTMLTVFEAIEVLLNFAVDNVKVGSFNTTHNTKIGE